MTLSPIRPFRWLRAFLRDTTGATATEFALVLPLFLLIVFGTINMALAMSAVVRLHFVTQTAARCLSVDTTGACTPGTINSYATSLYQIGGVSGLNFTATQPGCGNRVDGTGTYQVFTGMGNIPIGISASACYPEI